MRLIATVHYDTKGAVAVCGANQGRRLRSRVSVTSDKDGVTCARCRAYLARHRVGVVVECRVCGYDKKPVGRSAPMGLSYCDDDCPGYRQSPRPGSLWPRESEAQFGYPVGCDGTTDAKEQE